MLYHYIKPGDVIVESSRFKFARDKRTAVWRFVKSATRYDHVAENSSIMPDAWFATEYLDGLDSPPTSLSVYFWASMTDRRLTFKFPWAGVCLGDYAAARVVAGMLDPVDAFWMTGSFRFSDYANRGPDREFGIDSWSFGGRYLSS